MSVFSISDDGSWFLDPSLEPVEFWPYTTIVREQIFKIPERKVQGLHEALIKLFREATIDAYVDNKTVFALREDKFGIAGQPKMFYLGFKDGNFVLGLSILPDTGRAPKTLGSYVPTK